jgi:ubiquinone/menaquinone biosynthesis C-methylase UbiE
MYDHIPIFRTAGKTHHHKREQSLIRMADSWHAWDNDYRLRGQLWGGSPASLPDIPAGSRVLEIGCGSGKTVGALVHRSHDITAIDFSEKAVEMTRRVMMRCDAGDAVVADARHLPFHDNAFGYVVARHVIGHVRTEGRRAVARETARVLQPGGRLVVQEFSVDDMRNGIGREVEAATFLRGGGIVTHYFTIPELQALFSALKKESLASRHWTMRVRGRDLLRAEIVAVFEKEM